MSSGPRRTLLVCLSVLLAAVLGAGGWVLWGRDPGGGRRTAAPLPHSGLRQPAVEKTPHDARAGRLFTLDAREMTRNGSGPAPGSWATATSYVKTGYASISAHSLPGGKRLWRIPLSANVCYATRDVTPDGLTAVIVQNHEVKRGMNDARCDRLLVFDIDDGRKVWHTTLPRGRVEAYSAPDVTIGGGVVAVSWNQGSVAYPITGGRALWSEGAAACSYRMTLSGGPALIAEGPGCVRKRSERVIWKVDPRTGRPAWTYRVPRKYWTSAVLSTDPVTIAVGEGDTDVDHEDTEMTHVLSLDEHGRLRATIALDRDFDLYNWDSRERQHVVTRDTLYLAEHWEESGNRFGAVVAFDLRTGKAGKSFRSEAGGHVIPLRMSGDRLLVLQADAESGDKTVVKVFAIEAATGHRTLMLRAESSDKDVRALMGPDAPGNGPVPALFENGRLFFGRDFVRGYIRGIKPIGSKHRHPGTPADRYLGVVFGAD